MAVRIVHLCPACGNERPDPKKRFCSFECRFWAKVEVGDSSACWRWIGAKIGTGYGAINIDGGVQLAHRVAWSLRNEAIPEGMFICHRCDNPPCVNPSHLFLGSPADNMHDMSAKGRHGMLGRSHSDESRERIKAGRAKNPPKWNDERRAEAAERSRQMWADPSHRERIKVAFSTPEMRAKLSAAGAKGMAQRTRDSERRISESSRQRWADPEYRRHMSEAISRGRRKVRD